MGNRNVSYMTALLFVALWHGVWPGYMINFSFEFISVIAEKQVSKMDCKCPTD